MKLKPRNEQATRVARQLYEVFRAEIRLEDMPSWDALAADKAIGWKVAYKAWIAVAEATVFHHM